VTPTEERVLTAKGAATRQRIVEGAAQLIRARGLPNVGLDDIRAATATSKSQLFHYFPDGRADLLRAVARYEADQVIEEQMPHLGDLTTWRKWQTWRRRVITIYDDQRAGCPLSTLTAQLRATDPAMGEIAADLLDRWQAYLVKGVQSLKDSGEIAATIDPLKSATTILTAVTGGAGLLITTNRLTYLELALTDALDALRRGSTS
jgi:AcrR family transcriptional regulator